MNAKNDNRYRLVAGIGLAALLALSLLAQHRSNSDHSKHGHNQGAAPLAEKSRGLTPSGSLSDNTRVVDYDAYQYYFSPDPLIVYVGETVELRVKSQDSKHGVMIPEVDVSTEMPMGKRKSITFTAPDKPGEYPIFCSVFCGPGHAEMTGKLIVLPRPEEDKHPKEGEDGDPH